MKRRDFIKTSGLVASVPILMNGLKMKANASPILNQLALNSEVEDRILVVIQLSGGNDGLNTIIPVDQYDVISNLRESIFIPEENLINLQENLKLHPSLDGLKNLWEDEKLEIVLNIGYDNPNLSHFRSTDIWSSASDSDEFIYSGWIGRYLSEIYPDYPNNYPTLDHPDPISLTIGSVVSTTCQGEDHLMGLAVDNIDKIYHIDESNNQSELNNLAKDELDYIKLLMSQTDEYQRVIEKAAKKGKLTDELWKPGYNNELVNQLKTVARLINGGLKTKIYICSLGGFDTHSQQVDASSTLDGVHTNLLRELGSAISSFQSQLKDYGVEDKVLGVTFSEFGRRIRSNSSRGTDHGEASCQFLFGTPVNPTIHGDYEELNLDVGPFDNLKMQYDFRSVYKSILESWFRAPEVTVKNVMRKDFDTMPILKYSFTSVEEQVFEQSSIKLYPNPARSQSTLEFTSLGSNVKIDIFDANGNHLKTIHNKWLAEGNFRINLNGLANYPNGMYLVKVTTKFGVKTAKLNILK